MLQRDKVPAWLAAPWPVTVGCTALLSIVVLFFGTPIEERERQWFDEALRMHHALGRTPPGDGRVVVLGFDDVDMAALPDLAAEYSAVAQAVEEASDLGAAVIVLDAIYARGTPEMIAPILSAVDNGPPVVFAEAVLDPSGKGAANTRLRSFPTRAEPMRPTGLINIHADADGVYRGYPLVRWSGQSFEPSLALAAYLALRGVAWEQVRQPVPGVVEWSEPGGATRTLAERPPAPRLLNFRSTWAGGAGVQHITLRGLHKLHGMHPDDGQQPLVGKVIFLGNTATGVADLGATPFGPNQPLVLLHATALNDFLQDRALFRAPRWADALALWLIPLLATAGRWCRRKRGLVLLWLFGLAVIVAGGLLLFFQGGIVIAKATTAIFWTLMMVAELARRHTRELAERQHLSSTMSLYFPPRVLKDVLANPGTLDPKRVKITVLLSDLRNSTPLAEQLGTHGMLDLLNRVFEVENRAVFAEDGSLEKPVGDQFLAYWGAPEPQADDAERALRAALALIEGMEALKESLDAPVRALFGYGVALHRGAALIANIGSSQFFHYGVVGDLINATARIESLTKLYGVRMLVTRDALAKVAKPPPFRVVDEVIVKGKSTAIELCEVQDRFHPADFTKRAEAYAVAYALFRSGDFVGAETAFVKLASADLASRTLAARCALLREHPPADWHGVFKLDAK